MPTRPAARSAIADGARCRLRRRRGRQGLLAGPLHAGCAAVSERLRLLNWTNVVPVLALLVLAATWGASRRPLVLVVVGRVPGRPVLAAVHHAEVVAHRVGEPFGSLVLAVAVTVIEVALIVTLMISGGAETSTLARDTVFAARDDHLQRDPRPVRARRRAAHAASRRSTPRARPRRSPPWRRSPRSCLVLPTFTTSRPARVLARPARVRRRGVARPVRAVRRSSRPSATATTSSPSERRRPTAATRHAEPPSDREALDEPRAARGGARRRRRPGEDRVAGHRGRRRGDRGAAIRGRRGHRPARAAARDASPPCATRGATACRRASTSRWARPWRASG